MAISLSGLKQEGARKASSRRLAKEYEKQQRKESKRSGWSKFLGGVGGKLLGAAAIGLTGVTGGLAAPLLAAAGNFAGKKMAYDLTKGMGADTGKLTAGKYGYGGEEATTLREGLEQQLRAGDITKQRGAFGGELLSSFVSAGMSGGLGGAKGLLKGDMKFGQALTGQKDWAGSMASKEIGGLKGALGGISGLFDTSFLNKEGDPMVQDELFSGDTPTTIGDFSNVPMDWDDEELEEVSPISVPTFNQGGLVQGKAPSIVEYFSMQGKTLGGSNTQSLSQMLGR